MGCLYNKSDASDFMKGRTDEQQRVIKYFRPASGCLGTLFNKLNGMTDDQYKELVAQKIAKLDLRNRALAKIGLDEDQVREIEPIHFENWYFDSKNAFAKYIKKEHGWISSAYQVTWIFFSDAQVYVYQYLLNMDEDGKRETTEEYFYKDITNFSQTTETYEKTVYEEGGCLSAALERRQNVEVNQFQISAMGDKLRCAAKDCEETERSIQAMKAKLREKKMN